MRSISPSGAEQHGGVDGAALVDGDPRHVPQLHAEQVASGVERDLLDGLARRARSRARRPRPGR